jgi:hypothetical protein
MRDESLAVSFDDEQIAVVQCLDTRIIGLELHGAVRTGLREHHRDHAVVTDVGEHVA